MPSFAQAMNSREAHECRVGGCRFVAKDAYKLVHRLYFVHHIKATGPHFAAARRRLAAHLRKMRERIDCKIEALMSDSNFLAYEEEELESME